MSVLRGLIYYLATYGKHQFSNTINGVHQAVGRGLIEDANAFYVMSKVMQDAMTYVSQFRCQMTLVVDGLDECEEGLPQLLDFIGRRATMFKVKWLISSRPRLKIKDRLKQAGRLLDLSLELNAQCVSSVVKRYIDRIVEEIAEAKRYNKETTSMINSLLKSGASETFLWVSHICKALEKASRYKAASILDALPDGLRDTYRQMWNQVQNSDDAEARELCERILNAMTVAPRHVRLDQLGCLALLPEDIANDTESVKELIQLCGDFLVISQETVHFVHPTVVSYLSSINDERFLRPDLVKRELLSDIED